MEIAILYKYMQPRLRFSTILYKVLSYTESLNLYADPVSYKISSPNVMPLRSLLELPNLISESISTSSLLSSVSSSSLSPSVQPRPLLISCKHAMHWVFNHSIRCTINGWSHRCRCTMIGGYNCCGIGYCGIIKITAKGIPSKAA